MDMTSLAALIPFYASNFTSTGRGRPRVWEGFARLPQTSIELDCRTDHTTADPSASNQQTSCPRRPSDSRGIRRKLQQCQNQVCSRDEVNEARRSGYQDYTRSEEQQSVLDILIMYRLRRADLRASEGQEPREDRHGNCNVHADG